MPAIIDLKTEVLHQLVFELRYDFGQVYWDRAGRIAKSILGSYEAWEFSTIDINRCRVADKDRNLTFNFGHEKLDLSQAQTANVPTLLHVGDFGKTAESLANTVVGTLELELFPRIGFRAWHLYPTKSREESHRLVQNLKLIRIDADSMKKLGTASELSHRLIVDRGKHMVRVAVAAFEQQVDLPPGVIRAAKTKAREQKTLQRKVLIDQLKAKKALQTFPQFGILLDMDAYIEDPPYPDALTISDFIFRANEDFGSIKSVVLESAT